MTEKMREVVSHRGRMCLEVGAGNLTWDSGLTVGSKGLEPTDRVVAAGAGVWELPHLWASSQWSHHCRSRDVGRCSLSRYAHTGTHSTGQVGESEWLHIYTPHQDYHWERYCDH